MDDGTPEPVDSVQVAERPKAIAGVVVEVDVLEGGPARVDLLLEHDEQLAGRSESKRGVVVFDRLLDALEQRVDRRR